MMEFERDSDYECCLKCDSWMTFLTCDVSAANTKVDTFEEVITDEGCADITLSSTHSPVIERGKG